MEHELMALERAFWLGGAEVYEKDLAPQSLMVFPAPAGVLDRRKTIEAVAQAPRWKSAALSSTHVISPLPEVAILAYRVTADRGDGQPAYAALCSSTYVRVDGRWKLALHQQTPAAA